ncbi:hypothetical protein B5M09_006350 [Aphanomyces astaci]|uniref:MORN repeat-containing protein 5 n=1 Tax=Aphanomyces astaci TaxID=112090 RepID=A0A425DD08_APHAT|nr:hypothetical protein B5M09_006350 [Aphanomyces astaci]
MQDGHGRSYSSVSGETKEGTWKCHQPVEGKHAEWVILYPNNDKFIGTTQSGRPWGQGRTFEGEWRNSQPWKEQSISPYVDVSLEDKTTIDGQADLVPPTEDGVHVFTNNKFHELGDWEENRFHGMGMYTAADGSVFEGEFVHGIKQGMGKLSTADNHVYHGEFVHGERCGVGYGCHMDAKGTTKDGAWRGDLPVDGDWHIQFASGSSYNGECVGGKPHGHGVCKYTNGDARSGWGVCVFANGHVFQGEWTANHVSLNGKGTLTMANGTVHAYAQ